MHSICFLSFLATKFLSIFKKSQEFQDLLMKNVLKQLDSWKETIFFFLYGSWVTLNLVYLILFLIQKIKERKLSILHICCFFPILSINHSMTFRVQKLWRSFLWYIVCEPNIKATMERSAFYWYIMYKPKIMGYRFCWGLYMN